MAGEKDFQRRLELIERGIRELDAAADPGLRATAQQLVQAILELHGNTLERLLEIIHASGIAGQPIIDQLGRDPLVRQLLVLHSLHPLTLEARVLHALEGVRPSLHARHADVELVSIVEGVVRIRLFGAPDQKAAIEQALLDAAPDLTALEIEASAVNVVGFVPLTSLRHVPPIAAAGGA